MIFYESISINKTRFHLTIMSEDIAKSENTLVGLTLSPQILAKLDERSALTGLNRQEVIRQVLTSGLFQGC